MSQKSRQQISTVKTVTGEVTAAKVHVLGTDLLCAFNNYVLVNIIYILVNIKLSNTKFKSTGDIVYIKIIDLLYVAIYKPISKT